MIYDNLEVKKWTKYYRTKIGAVLGVYFHLMLSEGGVATLFPTI